MHKAKRNQRDEQGKSVDYSKRTALLIEGIKEQQGQVESLKEQVLSIERLEVMMQKIVDR